MRLVDIEPRDVGNAHGDDLCAQTLCRGNGSPHCLLDFRLQALEAEVFRDAQAKTLDRRRLAGRTGRRTRLEEVSRGSKPASTWSTRAASRTDARAVPVPLQREVQGQHPIAADAPRCGLDAHGAAIGRGQANRPARVAAHRHKDQAGGDGGGGPPGKIRRGCARGRVNCRLVRNEDLFDVTPYASSCIWVLPTTTAPAAAPFNDGGVVVRDVVRNSGSTHRWSRYPPRAEHIFHGNRHTMQRTANVALGMFGVRRGPERARVPPSSREGVQVLARPIASRLCRVNSTDETARAASWARLDNRHRPSS